MKRSNLFLLLLVMAALCSTNAVFAQVKIGGQKASAPHPSAVLELADSARGFLMPRVKQEQMLAIKDPANGLTVYNTTDDKIYVYRESLKAWKEVIIAPLEDAGATAKDVDEWEYNSDSAWTYLRRANNHNDTIFYNKKTGRMVFSDKYHYGNSLGQPDFNVDWLGGKWVFKSTASMMTDSLRTTSYTASIVNEIDNASNTFNDFHSGLLIATTKNPKSTQVSSQIQGANISTIHAGQDTAYFVSGVDNTTSINGNGFAQEVWGVNNTIRINTNSHNDVGNLYGLRNNITRSAPATGRVTGNVYGYFANMGGLAGKVDGTMYGIFMGNVLNPGTRRNYSIYTNAGLNRFGDSVLISNTGATLPRAIFDINSTSAMVIPSGSTAQRPLTNVQGMMRYNNTTNSPEYNNGAGWLNFGGTGGEWVYNALNNRTELTRGLALGDSVFYASTNRHFIFSDRFRYTNSQGLDFDADQLGGKFVFKSTASQMTDSASTSPYTGSFIKEVDNASNTFNDFHSSMLIATTVNPKSTQVSSLVQGANISSIHAGQDTVYALAGLDNTATVNGNGYTEEVWGLNNSARISANSHNDVLNMYGLRNTITRSAAATGKITGNVYGYLGSMGGLAGKVDGTIYGIFVNSVLNPGTRRNYALYTNAGLNRFGDSVLISNTGAILPRAIFDINSTSAMVIPNGTTAQRPATNVQGMMRYNNTTNSPEYNDGAGWLGFGANTGEWLFNNINNRVELTRGMPLGDTVFYSGTNRNFIFSDRFRYTNSQGLDFNADQLGGKFVFKSTASKMIDSLSTFAYTGSVITEVDNGNNAFSDSHSGLLVATTVNPKATQTSSLIQGANISSIHAGQDTVYALSGIDNVATVNGNGYTEEVWGLNNAARISSNSRNDVLNMYGIRNTLSRTAAATGKIAGNAYGYFGTMAGLTGKVDGTMYGIFLNSVLNGTTRRNYALYTNAGLNRFGDSVLISNTGAILPRAIFDINSTSAMVIPNGTTAQRPATNVQGMIRYNNTTNTPEFNNGTAWLGFGAAGGEWAFNGANNRVELTKGMPLGDTVFYSATNRNFIFSDRFRYTNSQGLDFNADQLGGKFVFKSTVSKMTDSLSSFAYTSSIITEVDNNTVNPNNDFHSGLLIATTVNPKATQSSSLVQGANISSIHAGQDTVYALSGLDNVASVNGNGYTEEMWGINNTARITGTSTNNVLNMYGMRNTITRSAAATGRINGNVYGYFGSMAGLSGRVDGTMYGIFLNTVSNPGTRRNYGIYTNGGLNRFGDSVLITNTGAILPRAVVDINATSAMIVPTGATASRPAGVTGMVRYNSSNSTLETFNGTEWSGTIRNTQSIDIPNIAANGNVVMNVTVPGATIGSVVYVSPSAALPATVVIAWARVSAADNVQISFNNVSAPAVNPAAQNFFIRVIQ